MSEDTLVHKFVRSYVRAILRRKERECDVRICGPLFKIKFVYFKEPTLGVMASCATILKSELMSVKALGQDTGADCLL